MRDRSQQITRRRRTHTSPVPETIFEDRVQIVNESTRPRPTTRSRLYTRRETQSHQIVRQPRRNLPRSSQDSLDSNLQRFHSQQNLSTVVSIDEPAGRSSYSGSTSLSSRYENQSLSYFYRSKIILLKLTP